MAKTTIPAYQLPEGFACPACNAVLLGCTPLTDSPRGFRKGHIAICVHCGEALVMGDSMFHRMTKKELEALPATHKDMLVTAKLAVAKKIKEMEKDET